MADKESLILSKGAFAFALHVTANSAQITIILGPKEALRNAI